MRFPAALPWLRLARVPAVFTALADIFAGFLLTHTHWQPLSTFFLLAGASAALYLSGMVFNDVFDVSRDRRERPGRPIPSGAISASSAAMFGSILMATGLALAAGVGINSLWVAIILSLAILLYDGGLKRTWLGPLSMGTCRFLNLLLGASAAAETFPEIWAMPQIWVATAMGVYIIGVTWFARSEAGISPRLHLLGGLVVLNLGLLLLASWILELPQYWGLQPGPVGADDTLPMLLFWGIVTISLNRRAIGAIADPQPRYVQGAVGLMLLSIITLDAMIIYFRLGPAGLPFALTTLALIFPAMLLKRWISMT